MIFSLARRLRDQGVLGINQRNAEYTLQHNPRHLYPLVDDKLRTKRLAEAAGIAVPELYAIVEIEQQIASLPALLHEHTDFVMKPARGSGGNGIVVIAGRKKGLYRKANRALMDERDMAHHVANILSGMYSLGGQPDKALIEYRVKFDPVFERITYLGVPDVRIIVFLGVPVMSMVRLPTRMSEGRANLHQGAIGAGIDIATGQTLTAVWHNDIITEHPDTGNEITGIQVPYWDRLLELAARCHELTDLGYVGVDIVLDKEKGPLVLELNARPGLNIQIANHAGLLTRLQRVEQAHQELHDVSARVVFAKQSFAQT
jgi:alpha-L-glutamate ligase-like protein